MRLSVRGYFVGVESMAGGHVLRTVHAIRVEQAGRAAAHEGVPEMKGLVLERIEPDGLERLGGFRRVEEQQNDVGRRFREHGKVDAVAMDGDAKRVGRPGFDRKDSHAGYCRTLDFERAHTEH